jgi:hypothetical protein
MKLLDAATVNPTDRPIGEGGQPDPGRWLQGYNWSSRACGVQVSIEDPCDPAVTQMINQDTTRPGSYFVSPWLLRERLTRPVTCSQPDDLSWARDAMEAATEMGLGRGLVTQVNDLAETWVGDAAVQTVALVASPSADQLGTAVTAAREQWFKTVVDPFGPPIMHVAPKMAIAAVRAGIMIVTGPDQLISVWGEQVVMNPGYDVATPHIFFTPKPVVHLGTISDEGGELYKAQINQKDIFMNRPAAIDIPPCAIVRVGS